MNNTISPVNFKANLSINPSLQRRIFNKNIDFQVVEKEFKEATKKFDTTLVIEYMGKAFGVTANEKHSDFKNTILTNLKFKNISDNKTLTDKLVRLLKIICTLNDSKKDDLDFYNTKALKLAGDDIDLFNAINNVNF